MLYLKSESMNWAYFVPVDTLSYFHTFYIGVVKNMCCFLGHGTVKSAVSQEWIDELSWFWTWWYNFRKNKSYFNKFYVGVVKTWCGLLVHETLKSAISGEWIDELSWFFSCWYKFMKAKNYVNDFWVDRVMDFRW